MGKYWTIMLSVLLVSLLLPNVAAYNDSLKVVVTVERDNYEVGEVVNFWVHVFDKGDYVDADVLNVTVGFTPANVIQTSVGVYQGAYTVKPTDDYVFISAEATRGTDDDEDYAFCDIGSGGGEEWRYLDVAVTFDDPRDQYVQPGDAVELTITVEEDGVRMDPDSLDVEIDDDSIDHERVETGVYEAVFEVPEDLTAGMEYDVYVSAEDGDAYGSGWEHFSVVYYSIYYHNISLSETSTTFELYVADNLGWGVEGAEVRLEYDDDYMWDTPPVVVEDVTDAEGMAEFTLAYEDVSYLFIRGNATFENFSQDFTGYLDVPHEYNSTPPMSEGFYVQSTDAPYVDSGIVRQNYTAYFDGAPWVNKVVYYYVIEENYTPTQVLEHGSLTTGLDGSFFVTFNDTGNPVSVHFESPAPRTADDYDWDEDDDQVYHEDRDYVYFYDSFPITIEDFAWDEDNITITCDGLWLGAWNTLEADISNAPSDATYMVSWMIGNVEEMMDLYNFTTPEWECWGGYESDAQLYLDNGTHRADLMLPSFFPADEDYTLLVGWYSPSEGYMPHWNRLVLTPDGVAERPVEPVVLENITISANGTAVEVKVGEGVVFEHGGYEVEFVLTEVTASSATLKLNGSDEPITIDLGETVEVDTDGNGLADLAITLESVDVAAQTAVFKFAPIEEIAPPEPFPWLVVILIVGAVIAAAVVISLAYVSRRGKTPPPTPYAAVQPGAPVVEVIALGKAPESGPSEWEAPQEPGGGYYPPPPPP